MKTKDGKYRIQKSKLIFISLILLTTAIACKKENPEFTGCGEGSGVTDVHLMEKTYKENMIFKAGSDGYHTYRIPSIIKTNSGTLIAFCEGRKNNSEDYGDIDLVAKRSTDNGMTWSSLIVIWDDGNSTCGNPTPVVDYNTGTIWLFMSWNSGVKNQNGNNGFSKIDTYGDRRLFSITSTDDGITWTDLTDRTLDLTPVTYTWDAVGPGNGIQLTQGPYKGRLMIPACGRTIYSDDHGTSWQYKLINEGTCEGCIVELCDETLMRNDRSAGLYRDQKSRLVSISKDFGITWSPWEIQSKLPDPICQASIIRYDESYPTRLVFINPNTSGPLRINMTVQISYDNGNTWPVKRLLQSWIGGYSCLCKTQDNNIASLQEYGGLDAHLGTTVSIVYRGFNLSWIINGKPEPVL
ncbi:MAG: exo-alpha-sialidase [Sphingobacteriales bacterium]|nr:exo-alpha-sialidase [Sphingobacteriales bacterium]